MNWDLMNFLATSALTIAIYGLQRSHEKEREQMEVEAQKKAVAEAARVFLIDNEDEIEYLPLSAIAKTLKLKRKHHRAITTKFLRCSEEVQKELIETFIAGVNDVDDVMAEWNTFVSEQREKELVQIIQEEKLKEPETRKYLANAFRDGEIKTVGTDIDKLMPPVSRFGGGGRAQKKQGVIDKLKSFFDKFFGIGGSSMAEDDSK